LGESCPRVPSAPGKRSFPGCSMSRRLTIPMDRDCAHPAGCGKAEGFLRGRGFYLREGEGRIRGDGGRRVGYGR